MNISALSQHRDLTSFLSAHEGQHWLRSAIMVRCGSDRSTPVKTARAMSWPTRLAIATSITFCRAPRLRTFMLLTTRLRRLAKPSIKSAVSYTIERDAREQTEMAVVGTHFKSVLEYAGLGGDTSFLKLESEASLADLLPNNCVCATVLTAVVVTGSAHGCHAHFGQSCAMPQRPIYAGGSDMRAHVPHQFAWP